MGRVIIEVSIPAAFGLTEKVQHFEAFRAGQHLQMHESCSQIGFFTSGCFDSWCPFRY
jgi:hypothetical protein